MQPIRLAVVGAGKLGGYHAALAAKLDEFELVAVVDPTPAAREALAARTGAQAVADVAEVIDRIDAAVVATPTVTHLTTTLPLLAAGVHTLVEKPIAPTKAEAGAMVMAARRAGRVLQVGHVERFNPALAAFPTPIHDPKFFQATRTSGYTFRSTDVGAVLDLMIHDIDLALALVADEVVSVEAMGLSVLGAPQRGAHEDLATARLTFARGCVALLTASRVSYEARRDVQVFGAEGFVAYDLSKGTATSVRPSAEVLARRFDGADLSAERKAELFAGKMWDEVLPRQEHAAPAVNAIELELLDFAHAIRTGQAPRVTGEAGRDAVAVAERVLESIARHRWDGGAAGRVGPFALPAIGTKRKAA